MNGTVADFGELSTRSVSTGNDGKASLSLQRAASAAASVGQDNVVDIVATPVGSNYGNTITRFVTIRLDARPNNPPPNGAPVAKFFVSPTTPKENDDVLFDGVGVDRRRRRSSTYRWNFGDGGTGSGVRAHHSYALAGSYQVTLTVTDEGGASATSDPRRSAGRRTGEPDRGLRHVAQHRDVSGRRVNFNAAHVDGAHGPRRSCPTSGTSATARLVRRVAPSPRIHGAASYTGHADRH